VYVGCARVWLNIKLKCFGETTDGKDGEWQWGRGHFSIPTGPCQGLGHSGYILVNSQDAQRRSLQIYY